MDIKTSKRNGPVIGIVPVTDDDELLMITSMGKIQRVAAAEINIIGRNTQGVRIMNVDDGDTLTAIVKVPKEDDVDAVDTDAGVAPPEGSEPLPSTIPLEDTSAQDTSPEASDSGESAEDSPPADDDASPADDSEE